MVKSALILLIWWQQKDISKLADLYVDIFYLIRVDKKYTFLDYLPTTYYPPPLVNLVKECPLNIQDVWDGPTLTDLLPRWFMTCSDILASIGKCFNGLIKIWRHLSRSAHMNNQYESLISRIFHLFTSLY